MTDQPEVYFKDAESGDVKAYQGIADAIRLSDNRVRVTLESGEKAKKDGRIIAVTGEWDIWTYYPNGTIGDAKMEKFEQVPRAFELPNRGVLVYNPFGKGGDSIMGSEIRRVKKPNNE